MLFEISINSLIVNKRDCFDKNSILLEAMSMLLNNIESRNMIKKSSLYGFLYMIRDIQIMVTNLA